ncbi:tetratricopeptide repeat protein [Saccharothrix saharensis]|nr:tetratricopeptide repeat protein [Saccharothrix saharensis]
MEVGNAVGGRVVGPVVQAGAITVHELLPVFVPPVPRQLPRRPALWVDRERELGCLTAVLAAGGDGEGSGEVVVVSGLPGMGKTALTLRWAHRHAELFPDGHLHADFTEQGLTAAVVLRRWLRALGVAEAGLPPTDVELAGLWRSMTSSRRLLLVLDGVTDTAQVRDLLPAAPGCLTVITSCRRLPGLAINGARMVWLLALTDEDAIDLLAAYAGPERAGAVHELRELAAACHGHPLALSLLGGQLAAHPELPVGLLAARYRDRDPEPAQTWTAAVTLAEDDLPAATRQLWRTLRALPVPDIGRDTIRVLAADPAGADAALTELVDRNLLAQTTRDHGDGDVRFHVPAILRATGGPPYDDVEVIAALQRLVEYVAILATAASEAVEPGKHAVSPLRGLYRFAGRAATREWFDREHACLLAVQRLAVDLDLDDLAWMLGEALWVPLRSGGHVADVLLSQRIAAEAVGRLGVHADGRRAQRYESTAWSRHGWALLRLGRPDEAAPVCLRAMGLADERGDDVALATALSTLAQAHIAAADPAAALPVLDRAITVDRRRGAPWWVIGLRWRHRAEARHALGDLVGARTAARIAVHLTLLNPVPRPVETARALTVLAAILLDLGDPDGARAEATRALGLLDPPTDRLYLAELHELIGRVETAAGAHDDAARHRALAAGLFEHAGHPQRASGLRAQHGPEPDRQ